MFRNLDGRSLNVAVSSIQVPLVKPNEAARSRLLYAFVRFQNGQLQIRLEVQILTGRVAWLSTDVALQVEAL